MFTNVHNGIVSNYDFLTNIYLYSWKINFKVNSVTWIVCACQFLIILYDQPGGHWSLYPLSDWRPSIFLSLQIIKATFSCNWLTVTVQVFCLFLYSHCICSSNCFVLWPLGISINFSFYNYISSRLVPCCYHSRLSI